MTAVATPGPDVGSLSAATMPDAARRTFLPHLRIDEPLRVGWPLFLCTAAMPVMFLLGAHGLIWALPGAVLGFRLAFTRSTRLPGAGVLMLLFLGWAAASALVVEPSGAPLFAYRWLLFVGALAAELLLFNTSEVQLPTWRVVRWLSSLWISLIVFGCLALLFRLELPSPLLLVAPGPISSNDFFTSISEWRLAEVQGFLGFELPRPAAPFPAANGWGAGTAILMPFFIRDWLVEARGPRRVVGVVISVIAAVPILFSLNRGLWVSAGMALVYLSLRRAIGGSGRALAATALVALAVVVALVATPAGDLVNSRVEASSDSNESRGSVYSLAWDGAQDSPLLGHGAPEPNDNGLPPTGTHGMLWYLMFVHGFVAMVLFVGWLGTEVVMSAPTRGPTSIWAHMSLLIAFVQVPIYGLLPQVVIIGMAAGIARRDARAPVGNLSTSDAVPA